MATFTSDASRFVEGDERPLTAAEHRLMTALLAMVPEGLALTCELSKAKVQAMRDGGMGSVRFTGTHRMGRELVAARAIDSDAVPVEISLNLDDMGRLFELDIWKVDFSPLLQYPEPSAVTRA